MCVLGSYWVRHCHQRHPSFGSLSICVYACCWLKLKYRELGILYIHICSLSSLLFVAGVKTGPNVLRRLCSESTMPTQQGGISACRGDRVVQHGAYAEPPKHGISTPRPRCRRGDPETGVWPRSGADRAPIRRVRCVGEPHRQNFVRPRRVEREFDLEHLVVASFLKAWRNVGTVLWTETHWPTA